MFDIITCVNNDALYARMQTSFIEKNKKARLNFIPVYNAKSMTSGYNIGRQAKQYKYTLYVHQDVQILNGNLLNDLLKLFENPAIGAIGMVGCYKLPSSQIFWESQCVGKVKENRGEGGSLLDFGNPQGPYASVEMVDGLFIASSLDIPWNEQITSFDFYDVSYCQDVIKNGKMVVVPRQDEPWLYHNSMNNDFDAAKYLQARDNFKRIYNK